jgi:hypothetical protein
MGDFVLFLNEILYTAEEVSFLEEKPHLRSRGLTGYSEACRETPGFSLVR